MTRRKERRSEKRKNCKKMKMKKWVISPYYERVRPSVSGSVRLLVCQQVSKAGVQKLDLHLSHYNACSVTLAPTSSHSIL